MDSNGIGLPYEITHWSKSNGHLEAWIRLAEVSSIASTTFYLYYGGDPEFAPRPDPTATFSGYLGVWHMDDSLATATVNDSTGTMPGTATGLTTTDQVSGRVGGAIDFNGTNQIAFKNTLTGSGSHTISAWVNARTASGTDTILALGTGAVNEARFMHVTEVNNKNFGFFQNDWVMPITLENAGWTSIYWVFDGNSRTGRLYRNGVLVAGPFTYATGINTTGSEGYLGYAPAAFGSTCGLNGSLDEVRVSTTTLDPAWIATEYANQSDPASFYTVGPEQ